MMSSCYAVEVTAYVDVMSDRCRRDLRRLLLEKLRCVAVEVEVNFDEEFENRFAVTVHVREEGVPEVERCFQGRPLLVVGGSVCRLRLLRSRCVTKAAARDEPQPALIKSPAVVSAGDRTRLAGLFAGVEPRRGRQWCRAVKKAALRYANEAYLEEHGSPPRLKSKFLNRILSESKEQEGHKDWAAAMEADRRERERRLKSSDEPWALDLSHRRKLSHRNKLSHRKKQSSEAKKQDRPTVISALDAVAILSACGVDADLVGLARVVAASRLEAASRSMMTAMAHARTNRLVASLAAPILVGSTPGRCWAEDARPRTLAKWAALVDRAIAALCPILTLDDCLTVQAALATPLKKKKRPSRRSSSGESTSSYAAHADLYRRLFAPSSNPGSSTY